MISLARQSIASKPAEGHVSPAMHRTAKSLPRVCSLARALQAIARKSQDRRSSVGSATLWRVQNTSARCCNAGNSSGPCANHSSRAVWCIQVDGLLQQIQSGQVVPESGIYRVTHTAAHGDGLSTITLIKGRRAPNCPLCGESSFELIYSDRAVWRHRSRRRVRFSRFTQHPPNKDQSPSITTHVRSAVGAFIAMLCSIFSAG